MSESTSSSGPLTKLIPLAFTANAINIPRKGDVWPMRGVRCDGIKSKPVYGGFWRWLFRRPRYWQVTYTFTATILLLCLLLTGCSAKSRISTAAALVQGKAASAINHIDAATATGDVGPKAQPHLDDAKADIGEIGEAATAITEALPGVVDREGWFARLLTLLLWLVGGGAVVFVLFYFSPWFKPVIAWTGAVLNLVPKPMRLDAQADAAYIAETAKAGTPRDELAVRAIEVKKQDARYKRVLDAELAKKGVPT